jgi:hypothetical protein
LSNVKVHPVALGSAPRTASLSVSDREHPGQNTLGGFSYQETSRAYSIEVPVETLDQVVEREGLKRLDLMKIDVEGSETGVIRGAEQALKRFRPVIIAEANETALSHMGSSTKELLDLIKSLDYEVNAFGKAGVPEPITNSESGSMNVICYPLGK